MLLGCSSGTIAESMTNFLKRDNKVYRIEWKWINLTNIFEKGKTNIEQKTGFFLNILQCEEAGRHFHSSDDPLID